MLYLLEFPTVKLLDRFLQTLGAGYTEVNARMVSIVCEDLPEDDQELAKKAFQATVTEIRP